jgi:hypothetical protein
MKSNPPDPVHDNKSLAARLREAHGVIFASPGVSLCITHWLTG